MCRRSGMLFAAAIAALLFSTSTAAQVQDFSVIEPSPGYLKVTSGEIIARLRLGACEPGYEDACAQGAQLQRSEYLPSASHSHGETVTYRWEIFVPNDFVYETLSGDLRAGRFYNDSGEAILSFLLDGTSGLTVNRKTCFGPEGFGQWHQVEVKAVWDSTKKKGLKDKTPGAISISCDGVEVHSSSGRPTVGEGKSVWLALGLRGAMRLADGDNATAHFRNLEYR
ncbi:MAG: hypothetical protein OXQ92_12660 [Boseongicola sp.]|nr:hypothetical protein [Boseongicola sp.]MDD9978920.1 hypothetical protein [Boseongicola sp.]